MTKALNDTQVAMVLRLLRAGHTQIDLAARFAVSRGTIQRIAKIHQVVAPERGARSLSLRRPVQAPSGARPTLTAPAGATPLQRAPTVQARHFPELPPASADERDRLVAEALAAGVGRRYEWTNGLGRMSVVCAADALPFLERQGYQVERRRKAQVGAIMYRVTSAAGRAHARPWVTAWELTQLAQQIERDLCLRQVPISTGDNGGSCGSDKARLNRSLMDGIIRYHDHPSRRPVGG